MPDGCGAETQANALLISLTAGKTFELPAVNLDSDEFKLPNGTGLLYAEISKLTNEDLTTRIVGGTGVFDALMDGISVHLKKEYEANRLSGAQYKDAYVGVVGGALQTAASYLLGRDAAYWQAINAQLQARALEIAVVAARVGLETAKATLAAARYQALTAEAEYGLTKMKIATEDAQYCLLLIQKASGEFTNEFLLPVQRDMLKEQLEAARAQTMDTRTTGVVIRGSIGKQKELYDQQITSYKRDAEVKAAKMFVDAWITQKTIDEGLQAPNGFTNESLDTVLTAIKINNQIN